MADKEIVMPIWLLQDESISPEMLMVWAKMRAKIPLQAREMEVRSQLCAKGLVRPPVDVQCTGAPPLEDQQQDAERNKVRGAPDDAEIAESTSGSNVASLVSYVQASSFSKASEQDFLLLENSCSDSEFCAGIKKERKENQKRKEKGPITTFSKKKYIIHAKQERDEEVDSTNPTRDTREELPTEREEKLTEGPRAFNALDSAKRTIHRFTEQDPRPYKEKMAAFWKECHRVHRKACVQTIRDYLQAELTKRAMETGIELKFDYEEWRTVQRGHAQALHTQYYRWQPQDWREAIDFFSTDSFWQNIIVDVRTLRRNINRYVLWRQKKEPNKAKFAVVKVIGRR